MRYYTDLEAESKKDERLEARELLALFTQKEYYFFWGWLLKSLCKVLWLNLPCTLASGTILWLFLPMQLDMISLMVIIFGAFSISIPFAAGIVDIFSIFMVTMMAVIHIISIDTALWILDPLIDWNQWCIEESISAQFRLLLLFLPLVLLIFLLFLFK